MRPRVEISPAAYRTITLLTLVSLVFIMVTGAAVRLTGSGLGCSTWPSCEPDSFFARTGDTPGMIEDGNRMVTGLVGLFSLAAVLGARWRRPYRRDLFRWSLSLPAWVMANALVGAMVVWLELTPVSVIGHFLLSLGALWSALVLHHKAGEEPAPGGRRRPLAEPVVNRACTALLVAAGAALVTGTLVTGSGPHAGDERAARLPFEVDDVARIHGLAVVLFGTLTLAVWWLAQDGSAAPPVTRRVRRLFVVIGIQAAVGYTQYFTGLPNWLVGTHVLGSALVWLAVLSLWLGLTEPVPAAAPRAATAPEARPASASEPPSVVIGG